MGDSSTARQLYDYVRSCTVHTGRLVFYDRGEGPALVLVHGMFGDYLDWETVLEPLSRNHRVIAVDLPGHGASDKPDFTITIQAFASALRELLNHLEIPCASLVGGSFGGEVVAAFASEHQDRTSALVLVCSAGMKVYPPEQIALLTAKFSEENLRSLTPAIQEILLSSVFHTECPERKRYLNRQNGKLNRRDFADYAKTLAQCGVLAYNTDTVSMLRRLRIPTLLLWGERDVFFPVEQARAALPLLPQARLSVVESAGHAPQLERPREFIRHLELFLNEVNA